MYNMSLHVYFQSSLCDFKAIKIQCEFSLYLVVQKKYGANNLIQSPNVNYYFFK